MHTYTFLPIPTEVLSVAVWCDEAGKLTQCHAVVGFCLNPVSGHGQALICTTLGQVTPIEAFHTPDLFCGLMAPSIAQATKIFKPLT